MSFPIEALFQRRLWQAPLAAGVLALVSACSGNAAEIAAPQPVIAPRVQGVDVAASAHFPGEVHARYEMPLSFRVGGQLVERYVNPGDIVKKGQPLAKLDEADATSSQTSARAALEAAEHRLGFAAQQRDRDQTQAAQNLISQVQLEQTLDAYAAAVAARDQARQQFTLGQNQLRYNTLLADRDGVVTSAQAQVGQVVAAGQAVFGFAWLGEREVFVDVPEARVGGISAGQAATIKLIALPGRDYAGRVREISPAADPQSRTYRVKLSLTQSGPEVQLGMTAEVALSADTSVDPVRIPVTALFHQGDLPAVWVVRPTDSTLELRPVTVTSYGERDVLVGSGLKVGERVLMQGVHTASAGEKVTPVDPPRPEDAPL